MLKSVKICLSSLGCAKNLVDTEVMAGSLAESGAVFTTDLEKADIHVINTCSFIDRARDESFDAIAQAVRWKAKRRNRKVVVAGCLAQRMPQLVQKKYPKVDLIVGLDEVQHIAERLDQFLGRFSDLNTFVATDLPVYLYNEMTPRVLATPRHYAYIKIAEGCNMKCSFCAIPTFRGKERSRSIESIALEAQKLLDRGVRELILVSQNSSRYGFDRKDGTTLVPLLQRLDNLEADEYWLRVLYLYPTSVSDELIDAFATCRHLTRYVDMPLQHISDKVLKRMRRGITKKRSEELLRKFRERVPGVTMRTTFLVGHPGEEEEDFAILREFVQEQRFDRFGVFTYSHEENTHAYQFTDFVGREIADRRRAELMVAQQEISLEKNSALIGSSTRVLIDDVRTLDDGSTETTGRTQGDAPQADNLVHFTSDGRITDEDFCDVVITAAEPYDLYGEVAPATAVVRT